MDINALIKPIKNERLKVKLQKAFKGDTDPEEIADYVKKWRLFAISVRVAASIITLGIIPLVYFIWSKHHSKPHTNWVTKPNADTDDAMIIIKGACELTDSSVDESEENSTKIPDRKLAILPHDSKQSRATLVTIHGHTPLKFDEEKNREESTQELVFEERSHATILANGKTFITSKYKDPDEKVHYRFDIYNDKNKPEKKDYSLIEGEESNVEKFPFIRQHGDPVVVFSKEGNTLFIHGNLGKPIITIKRTNIPENALIIPINLYFNQDMFYVFLAAEYEGIITLHQFSNNNKHNSSSQLFDGSSEVITALTYNSAHSIIYAIDTEHHIHSIRTNQNRVHPPIIDGSLSDLPDSTHITKLTVSHCGHFLYAADSKENLYYYHTSDFKKFTRLKSSALDKGKILDMKCLDDPKFIDQKNNRLLIVTTEEIYSEQIDDIAEDAQENSEHESDEQSSDEKSQTNEPAKSPQFLVSLEKQSLFLMNGSKKTLLISVAKSKSDKITVYHYDSKTACIYAGTEQGFLHIASIDKVDENIATKNLGNGAIQTIDLADIMEGVDIFRVLLIRHEKGMACLYDAKNTEEYFGTITSNSTKVLVDGNQNLIARSNKVDTLLCKKADLLQIMKLRSFSPGLANQIAKHRVKLHKGIDEFEFIHRCNANIIGSGFIACEKFQHKTDKITVYRLNLYNRENILQTTYFDSKHPNIERCVPFKSPTPNGLQLVFFDIDNKVNQMDIRDQKGSVIATVGNIYLQDATIMIPHSFSLNDQAQQRCL